MGTEKCMFLLLQHAAAPYLDMLGILRPSHSSILFSSPPLQSTMFLQSHGFITNFNIEVPINFC